MSKKFFLDPKDARSLLNTDFMSRDAVKDLPYKKQILNIWDHVKISKIKDKTTQYSTLETYYAAMLKNSGYTNAHASELVRGVTRMPYSIGDVPIEIDMLLAKLEQGNFDSFCSAMKYFSANISLDQVSRHSSYTPTSLDFKRRELYLANQLNFYDRKYWNAYCVFTALQIVLPNLVSFYLVNQHTVRDILGGPEISPGKIWSALQYINSNLAHTQLLDKVLQPDVEFFKEGEYLLLSGVDSENVITQIKNDIFLPPQVDGIPVVKSSDLIIENTVKEELDISFDYEEGDTSLESMYIKFTADEYHTSTMNRVRIIYTFIDHMNRVLGCPTNSLQDVYLCAKEELVEAYSRFIKNKVSSDLGITSSKLYTQLDYTKEMERLMTFLSKAESKPDTVVWDNSIIADVYNDSEIRNVFE